MKIKITRDTFAAGRLVRAGEVMELPNAVCMELFASHKAIPVREPEPASEVEQAAQTQPEAEVEQAAAKSPASKKGK